MTRLSPKQAETWRAMNNIRAERGIAPIDPLAHHFGISHSSMYGRLMSLERKGVLTSVPAGERLRFHPVRGIAVDKSGVVYHEVCHAGQAEGQALPARGLGTRPEAAEGADEDDRLATAAEEDAGRAARDVGGLAVAR